MDNRARQLLESIRSNRKPHLILKFRNNLRSGIFNADQLLTDVIRMGRTREDLLLVAMCLRYGANHDMYVSAASVSNHIHILGYTYRLISTHRNQMGSDYPDTLMALLIFSGSDLSKPIYDSDMGGIKPERELMTARQSVYEWLINAGYNTVAGYREKGISNYIDHNTRQMFHILLDQPEEIIEDNKNNRFIIRALGERINSKLIPTNNGIYWRNEELTIASDNLNLEAYIYLLSQGKSPNYPSINEILLHGQRYHDMKEEDAEKSIVEMIKAAIGIGIVIDEEQMILLNKFTPELIEGVVQAYNKPYWKKACTVKHAEMPPKLKEIAISLDIYSGCTDAVCKNINEISLADPTEVKNAAFSRNAAKTRAEFASYQEFIGEKGPNLVCENISSIDGNPDDYGDVFISRYRDVRGKLWCYTSEYYDDLLSYKKNPIIEEDLPENFIEQVTFKKSIINKLGLGHKDKPPKISTTIVNLNKTDEIGSSDSKIELILERMEMSRSKFMKLTPIQIESILDEAKITTNIGRLSQKHALLTFAWILDWSYQHNNSLLNVLHKSMNRKISSI